MHLPAARPDPSEIQITDSSRFDDFAALARVLREQQGRMTLVYSSSTTTITNMAPDAGTAPIELRVQIDSGRDVEASMQTEPLRPRYTAGEVIAYSGTTLMGGGILSDLVTALLRVPLLVPVLGGVTAVVGMLAAVVGSTLDLRERSGGVR